MELTGNRKIVVINGTEVKGCTWHIKEFFLERFRSDSDIVEFYLPKDFPYFCCGCKACFFNGEASCPHAAGVAQIWNAMLAADLIVFAYPVYVLRAPGQVKALLDHIGVHWMVHRPKKEMFRKRAVILTNSVGAPNGSAQKDVAASLSWLGVSSIKKLGFALMEGVIWNELSENRRHRIETKVKAFASKLPGKTTAQKSLKHRLLFAMCKMLHQKSVKIENPISTDNQYWLDMGWIHKKAKRRDNGTPGKY
jgi:multimeric flavodoxin WrbA